VASCEGSMSLTALADDDRACESNAAPAASPAPSRFASLFLGRAIGGQS